MLCFALVLLAVRVGWGRDLASSTIYGMTAAMTNTGFVALPILHSIYGRTSRIRSSMSVIGTKRTLPPC
jgi:malonate transporter and related proteins